jgi:hypothetical protein
MGAVRPGAVDLSVRLLPGRAIAQPGNGLNVGSVPLTLGTELERGIDVGI